jgi:5-methylcytosine-specific restriction enzyme subunit McrC
LIRLTEGGSWQEEELTTGQAAALSAAQVVRVAPGPRPGLWSLRDNGLVGAARVGPVHDAIEVRIEPKLPIDRLFFLLGYARKPRGWRQEDVAAEQRDDLLPALAYAFARAAERALRQGVLLGYVEIEEALPVIRGRMCEADQIRRRYGLPLPVEVRYDDFTVDIAENRLLLAAALRLLALPGVPPQTRRLLRHLLLRLDGVERLTPGRPLPAWTPTRLNTRYHTALGIAELVLRGASYELSDGTTMRVDGLLLEMWRVFEDFVTVGLTEALRPYGGRVGLQDTRHHLDQAGRVQLRPDLVYYTPSGEACGVADAKYKVEKEDRAHQADLYQMLAYCTAMKLSQGHLIYAAGATAPATHVVREAGIEIVCHALDLGRPAEELLSELQNIADRLGDRASVTAHA